MNHLAVLPPVRAAKDFFRGNSTGGDSGEAAPEGAEPPMEAPERGAAWLAELRRALMVAIVPEREHGTWHE